MPLPDRLRTLADELRALVAEFQPESVVVERVFFQVNARTAMATGQAGGVALVAAAEAGCEVAQYTSNEVKQAVVGYGGRHQGAGAADGGRRCSGWPSRPVRPTWPTPWPWPSAISPPSPSAGPWPRPTGEAP